MTKHSEIVKTETPGAVASTDGLGEKEREYLSAFYRVNNAITAQQKSDVLMRTLGGTFNFYSDRGPISDEMKLAALEYEHLERMGVLKLPLA